MKRSSLPGGFSTPFHMVFLSAFLLFTSGHLLLTPLPLYIERVGGTP